MEEVIKVLRSMKDRKFTGKIIVHFQDGNPKQVNLEEMILKIENKVKKYN